MITILTLLIFAWTSTLQAFSYPHADDAALNPALYSQTTTSLIANKGDPFKAAKSMANSDTLKNIGLSMALAGAISSAGISTGFETNAPKINTTTGHIANQTIRASAQFLTNTAFGQDTDPRALLLGAVAGAVGGKLSNEIGD